MTFYDKTKVADMLDDAADNLERNGWTQGALQEHDGRRCAMGALGAVRCTGNEASLIAIGAMSYLAIEVGATYDLPDVAIAEWNDAEGRTEQDVLDAMRRAAKRARVDADAGAP